MPFQYEGCPGIVPASCSRTVPASLLCSCEVQNVSNPLHLRQSLFALQVRAKVIKLRACENVTCKAGLV